MACKTCNHTMHSIADNVFWCPRCGTLYDQMQPSQTPPKIIAHVRDVLAVLQLLRRDTVAVAGWRDQQAFVQMERALRECAFPPDQRERQSDLPVQRPHETMRHG